MAKPAPCVIEPHYHQMRVIHKRGGQTVHIWPILPGSAVPPPEPGIIFIEPDVPPPDEKHIALGRFMDTWSKFELMLRSKLQDLLLSGDDVTATAVSYTVSGAALMQLIMNLASIHLMRKDRLEYANLSERFTKLNTKRNYLAHGWWTLEIIVALKNGEPDVVVQEVREYPPPDHESRKALMDLKNQSARGRYLFTLKQIEQTERDVAKLYEDFTAFHNSKLARLRTVRITHEIRG